MTPTTDHPILRLFALTNVDGVAGQKAAVPPPVGGAPNTFAGLIAELGREDLAARGKGSVLGDVPAMPDPADSAPGSTFSSTLDQLRSGGDAGSTNKPRRGGQDGVGDRTSRDPLPDEETAQDQAAMGTPSLIECTPNLIALPSMALSDGHVQTASQAASQAARSHPEPEAAPVAGAAADTQSRQSAPFPTADVRLSGAMAAHAQVAPTRVSPSTSDRRGNAQTGGVEKAAPNADAAPSPTAPSGLPIQQASLSGGRRPPVRTKSTPTLEIKVQSHAPAAAVADAAPFPTTPPGLPIQQASMPDGRTPPVPPKSTPTLEVKVQSHAPAAAVADTLAAPQSLMKGVAQGNLGQGFDVFLQDPSNVAANSVATTTDAPAQTGEPVVISTVNPDWEIDFVDSIVAQVTGADAVIEIALSPENLGQIDVRIEMREGRADVFFVTETRDAARLFAQAEGRLSDLMQRHGLDLGGQDSSQRQGDQRSFTAGRAHAPNDNETSTAAKTAPEGRVNLVA